MRAQASRQVLLAEPFLALSCQIDNRAAFTGASSAKFEPDFSEAALASNPCTPFLVNDNKYNEYIKERRPIFPVKIVD